MSSSDLETPVTLNQDTNVSLAPPSIEVNNDDDQVINLSETNNNIVSKVEGRRSPRNKKNSESKFNQTDKSESASESVPCPSESKRSKRNNAKNGSPQIKDDSDHDKNIPIKSSTGSVTIEEVEKDSSEKESCPINLELNQEDTEEGTTDEQENEGEADQRTGQGHEHPEREDEGDDENSQDKTGK